MNDQKNKSSRRFLWTAIRIAGTCLALGITLWLLPRHEVLATMRSVPLTVWLFTFCVFLAGNVVAAAKWWLLTSRSEDVPFRIALKAHFAGQMANVFLPGAVGGDVVRVGMVFKQSQSKPRIAVGSAVDRILDSLGLLLLSCVGGLFALGGKLDNTLLQVGAIGLLAVVSIPVFLFVLGKFEHIGIVAKVRAAILEFRQEPLKLVLCLALSMSVQATFIGLNITLARSSGIHIPVAAWFFAWPLSKLIAVLPISLGGLGVREASLAALLTRFGAPAARTVAVGLVWQTILMASATVGAIVLLVSTRSKLSPAGDLPR